MLYSGYSLSLAHKTYLAVSEICLSLHIGIKRRLELGKQELAWHRLAKSIIKHSQTWNFAPGDKTSYFKTAEARPVGLLSKQPVASYRSTALLRAGPCLKGDHLHRERLRRLTTAELLQTILIYSC